MTWTEADITQQQNDVIGHIYTCNTLLIAQAGAGKTVVAQTAAQELIDDGELSRVIIFAPLKVCQLTWSQEWAQWSHLLAPRMAIGNANQRRDAVNSDAALVCMNLDNMAWFFKEFGHDHGFDGLIIDEVSKLKDPGSTAFKKLRHHLVDFNWRLAMSATPVHEAATDIYTQIFIVDGGKALGKNNDRFKRKYFTPTDYKEYNWDWMPTMEERLVDDITHLVCLMDTEEYEANLPVLEDIIVPVIMPPEAHVAYDAFCNTLIADINDKQITAANLAVRQGKLQQVCCGAVYDMNGNTQWIHKAKYEQLTELVGAWQEPVVIVYQFKYELEMLQAMYPDAMVLGDDPVKAQTAWNAGELHVLLVHPKSASHGINIQQGGCRMIWMSPVWSADQWDQCIRRLWRRGQPSDTVWRYILLVEGTVERLILARHTEKMDNASSFIDHIRQRAAA